jgi:ADP-ribosylglycohydrolase
MNKIIGMIYGAMYGDALGIPYERIKKDKIIVSDKIRLKIVKRFNRYTKEYKYVSKGQFSDDTEMAIVLLNHLVSNNMNYDHDKIVIDYMRWSNSKNPFLGKNTRALLYGVKTLKGYNKRFAKHFPDNLTKQNAQSNGSLMRCYPLAILGLLGIQFDNIVHSDCFITNPSDLVYDGQLSYVRALVASLQGCLLVA